MAEWSEELPTEEGWYWFYGWMHGEWKEEDRYSTNKPSFWPVEARATRQGFVYIVKGHFMYERMPIRGYFIKTDLPAGAPSLDDAKERKSV
jgi:hypothetical protein